MILLTIFFRDHIRFSRWTISEPGLIQDQGTDILIPKFEIPPHTGNISMVEDKSTIVMVSNDRTLYEIDSEKLTFRDSTLMTSKNSTIQHQTYCQRNYWVSGNGLEVVGAHFKCPAWSDISTCDHDDMRPLSPGFRNIRITLQFALLSGTNDQVRTVELEYSDFDLSTSHEYHETTFSPDLSLLQAGPHIYDLSAPGHPRLSFPDFPPNYRGRPKEDSEISFSPCGKYMITIKGRDPVAEGEKAIFGIFRIYRTAGRLERVLIADLEGLAAASFLASFHPTLPLLLLTCHTHQNFNIMDVEVAITVVEVDLEALESIPIELPKFRSVPLM